MSLIHLTRDSTLKPGRNDPCPCGSGEKYKRCCGALPAQAPAKAVVPAQSERARLVSLFNAEAYIELEAQVHMMLSQHPDSGFLWKVLGATLQALGKEPLPAMTKAAELLPDDAEAHNNLANLLLMRGQFDAAAASLRKVVAIRPGFADVHNRLGAVLRILRQFEEAVSSCRRALKIKPDFAEAHNNLGAALQELGRLEEATTSYRRAIAINPDYASAHSNLGIVLHKLGRFEDAAACFHKALELNPDFPEAHNNLGLTLQALGKGDDAIASLRQALQINPEYVDALSNLGDVSRNLGQLNDAIACWQQVLKLNPEYIEARINLVKAKKVRPDNEHFAALVALHESVQAGNASLSEEDAISLNFALGKCYEDTENYEKAFSYFSHGSRLKRASFIYDAEENTRCVDQIIRIFDTENIARLHGGGDPSHLPIFVLGMPRSGTTLIEQIISSHPQVHGAGELPDLMSIVHTEIADTPFPDNLQLIDQPRLAAWGTEYVTRLKRHAPDMQKITDKAPINFLAIGLIHLMLPNARIIHVSRNPVDSCLSCFTKLFTLGQEYTYDLTELGLYYRDYYRLMEHWRNVLPEGTFLDVQYEDVIADTETQSRRIIEHCGLEWDKVCLEFYKNKRMVMTASDVQVRQPIYSTSVERWKKYEKSLSPLLSALGELTQK